MIVYRWNIDQNYTVNSTRANFCMSNTGLLQSIDFYLLFIVCFVLMLSISRILGQSEVSDDRGFWPCNRQVLDIFISTFMEVRK